MFKGVVELMLSTFCVCVLWSVLILSVLSALVFVRVGFYVLLMLSTF